MIMALVSAKHSPGTTTTAVALAFAADGLVVEADPTGAMSRHGRGWHWNRGC